LTARSNIWSVRATAGRAVARRWDRRDEGAKGVQVEVKRMAIIGLCVAAMLAVIPAVAQAGEIWELKETGPYKTVIPTVVLTSAGSLGIVENAGGTRVGKCKVTDEEEIWNTAVGEDEMLAFHGICKGGPFPCTTHEVAELILRGKWASTLHEVAALYYDKFSGVEIEVKCASGASDVYKQITANPLDPQVLPNKLKFAGAASGEMEFGTHTFYLTGVDKLKTPTPYKKVRAG
jgi:hypothetical protein